MKTVDELAEVIRVGLFERQVCVPETWDNERISAFLLEKEGIEYQVTKHPDDPERNPCSDRECFVHVLCEEGGDIQERAWALLSSLGDDEPKDAE